MKTASLTCINCPIGCGLVVTLDEGGEAVEVKGNLCARGVTYGMEEVTNPTRMMTSTVRLKGGSISQAPVKTSRPVPKNMVAECVKALALVEVEAPIELGQVVLVNVCGTGADVVITRSIAAI